MHKPFTEMTVSVFEMSKMDFMLKDGAFTCEESFH